MTSDELSELDSDTLAIQFEKAGLRKKLYFDPSKTTCAIVICGGLCRGINDVIRFIVMKAYSHYGISAVTGIRNGLLLALNDA